MRDLVDIMANHLIIAKLVISIKDVGVEGGSGNYYVKMRIGPICFQTPKRALGKAWGDTFEYRINMHAHLFYTLQVRGMIACIVMYG